ncbi:MAG TPA: hypothetical protein VFG51_03165, partial [Candidatus Saccharimonadia bacterium]|nr:hypothetical protein [Candidatus Saccharimonadia bacterium]
LTEKQYTFLDNTIAKDYPSHFVHLAQLLAPGWSFGDNLSLNLGYVQFGLFVLAILGVVMAVKHSKKAIGPLLSLFVFCVIAFFGALFFMLQVSQPLWDHLPLLPFVQFPWRFLMVTVPALSVAGSLGLYAWSQHHRWSSKQTWILVGALIIALFVHAHFEWNINQEITVPVVAGNALEGTTTWADEQATKWFLPKPTAIPKNHVEVLSGKSTSTITEWKSGEHAYAIDAHADTQVLENTMYYPGWRVWVDGQEVEVNHLDTKFPGRIVFGITKGNHTVMSRFTETPSRQLMDTISLLSFAGVVFFLLKPAKKRSLRH